MKRVIRKSRYFSVTLGGDEIYTEQISVEGDIRERILAGKLRLREIRKVMPLGKWGLNIEEQWKERNGDTHFVIVDVETGKVQEQVL